MESPSPAPVALVAAPGIHEPFSRTERMQQLSEIDGDIASLLELTGTALRALSTQPAPSSVSEPDRPPPTIDSKAQATTFQDAMEAFLSTLHSVDVKLRRQIMGLEEAGIVSLKENKGTVSPEPNGVGSIGNLDVGWLNSRSNKVERDMEAELWSKARTQLDAVTDQGSRGGEGGDTQMQG